MRRLLLCVVLLAAGCQPFDSSRPSTPSESPSASARLGAPEDGAVPQSLAALLGLARERALAWQDEPVLVQVDVTVDDQARWESAEATYAAGDADRLLTVSASSGGVTEQRVSLATLQLQPVPTEAIADVPPLPDDVLDPAGLIAAAGDDLGECFDGPAQLVLYATGAPYAWDGDEWSQPPKWQVSVSASDGEGAALVDPTTGAVSGCASS